MKNFSQFTNEDAADTYAHIDQSNVFAYLESLQDTAINELVAEWNAKMADENLPAEDKESWLRHYAGEIIGKIGEMNDVVSYHPKIVTKLGDKIEMVGNTLYDMAKSVLQKVTEGLELDAKMVCMSHLSDIQEMTDDKEIINRINFVKMLMMETKGTYQQPVKG